MPDVWDHPLNRCANCGQSFEYDVEYPVTTRVEDGEIQVYSFCDEDCQAEWEAEQGSR